RAGLLAACLGAFAAALPAPAWAQPDTAESTPESTAASGSESAAEPVEQVELSALRDGASAVPWWQRALSVAGLAALLGVAWLASSNRRRFPWRVVGWGLGLQLLFALFVLKTGAGRALFAFLNDVVIGLLAFTEEGSRFVFGDYLDLKFSFALNVLPTILFFSALMTVLYHLGVMQRAVSGLAWVMQRTMGTSGSETLSAAANIFVGQTEAPLVVKPYVSTMTRSELNAVMVGGFATVAGGVLAAYVGMLEARFPDIAGHLIAASVMSAPAALVVAKILVPETERSPTRGGVSLTVEKTDANVVDAAARGAAEGLKLALNVGAMLLAFLALVALLDFLVGLPVEAYNALFHTSHEPWTLSMLLGWVFWPVALLMGVAPEDCATVGALLGEKLVLNEFVAYAHLGELVGGGAPLQQRSVIIATYALCGFANFGSIGIQIGGISAIAPERRGDLAKLGLRAMIGGTLAACMTATVAGLLV
ncbi:MAG TPA: nucleoside transporter C-terminal domain-containing protein, partial [Polyangiaceae bacterium LLY-WYZ-15_(1-7)]|nr:nucleoside transporter C-terminal domain-containing protein [Polyangiaceae bacterium LLY-WYZ-15_(1-7)]